MAVELETKIMEAIGLGNHFSWFNGSASCKCRRTEAARRLHKAIEDAKNSGEDIDSPRPQLIRLAEMVAHNENGQFTLIKTWQVCSYIIQAHIHKDEESYRDLERYIKRNYLRQRKKKRKKE